MPTIDYRLGDTGVLGFAATNPDGSNMDLAGLGLRMRIATTDGYITLPAIADADEVIMVGGEVRQGAAVVAVPVADDAIMLTPRLYRFAIECNDGTGWRAMSDDDHFLNVVRF